MLSAKSAYECNLIRNFAGKNDSKIYKYISSITGQKTIPPTIKNNSESATTDHDKASLFNQYFYSVFAKSSFRLPPMVELHAPDSTLSNINISQSDVYDALVSLDPTKAKGIDGIGPICY